jgi:LacI family transcriptional regulator
VSLRDIAEELNLSVSMVSKVLNGRMGTSGGLPETVRAIQEKAREMGYRKNLQAQALRTGRLNIIAVCVHHHGARGSMIVESMVEGIAREAAERRQRLMLHYYTTLEELEKIWQDFNLSAVDGVVMGGVPHVDWVRQIGAEGEETIPLVTILPSELAHGLLNVGMSDVEITRRATGHLIERGCRNIAHICVRPGEVAWPLGDLRREGYLKALLEHQIPVRNELIAEADHFDYAEGQKAIEALLASGVAFDGVVAQSDNQILGALNVLSARGIRVPEQVKLIGIDDSPFCDMASVPLSSVSQEFQVRGRIAVRLLMDRIDRRETSPVLVDPVVRARRSTSSDSKA